MVTRGWAWGRINQQWAEGFESSNMIRGRLNCWIDVITHLSTLREWTEQLTMSSIVRNLNLGTSERGKIDKGKTWKTCLSENHEPRKRKIWDKLQVQVELQWSPGPQHVEERISFVDSRVWLALELGFCVSLIAVITNLPPGQQSLIFYFTIHQTWEVHEYTDMHWIFL